MSIEFDWDNANKTVIRTYMPNEWVGPDFTDLCERLNGAAATVAHPVGIIFDLEYSKKLPMGILKKTRNIVLARHLNIKVFMIKTDNRFVTSMYRVFESGYPSLAQVFRLAMNEDDVHRILSEFKIAYP